MKIVFKFKILGIALLMASAARAEMVYFSTRDLLVDFFPHSQSVTYRRLPLSAIERSHLVEKLGYAPAKSSYTFFIATTGAHLDGYALVDEEKGEHMPITFAVKLSPAGVVERQEIVAYREARGDEVRDQRFRHQFVGKSGRDPIVAGDDIVAVSGATISSRAMALGVKRAVVLFQEVLPRLQTVTAQNLVHPPAP